jgi:hypothetical protein
MTSRTKMNRRTVLQGLFAGSAVSVGLPTLEAMLNANGTAYAQTGAPIPRRLGVFFWGNGVRLKFWTPSTSPSWEPTPSLMPLAPVKEYVNVVSGMDIKIPRARVHHTGTIGILSGAPVVVQPRGSATYRSTFSKPSIDQIAAAELGKSTRFKSLELGISRRVRKDEGVTPQVLSHNGTNSGNPPSFEPREVFTRLFGGTLPPPAMAGNSMTGPSALQKATAMRRSVLDGIVQDIERMKMRVGSTDKRRLDQHFENVRAIERRLQAPESMPAGQGPSRGGCAPGAAPGTFPNTPQGEQLEPITTAMSDLAALALACDQTRVFSLLFTGSISGTVFWPAGVRRGHHQLTHDEPGDQPQIQATTVFTMRMLAILLQKLKDTPEGAGNLLDSCAILATSDCSEGKSHSIRDYPILVAGRAGGFFKHPGVHHREVGGNTSTVLLSLLRSVGLSSTEVGAAGGRATTGLSAIEA